MPLRGIGQSGDSGLTPNQNLLMTGQLESTWSHLLYAKGTLCPVRLVLKATLFLLLRRREVFLVAGAVEINWGFISELKSNTRVVYIT